MTRMTISFLISAVSVWFWFRWLPKREGLGPLPDALAYFIPCWLMFGCISWCLLFFFIDGSVPEDLSFFGWYAEAMSYLATAILVFPPLGGSAWHAIRRKFKIPPQNLSEKFDDFIDPL